MFIQNLNISWLVILVLLSALGVLFMKDQKFVGKKSPVFITALGGSTLMASEIMILFAFQVKLGYLYSQICLLLTFILAGMAGGNFFANYKLKNTEKTLKIVGALMAVYLVLLPFLLKTFEDSILFLATSATIGFLVGTIFPMASKLYLKNTQKIGTLYAADLFGSLFGALLPSVIFIPVLGISQTCLLLGVVNLTTVLFL